MADRSTFNGGSTEVPWQNTGTVPEGFGDQYARHIKALYDASALPLTSVGGTGDNVTATVDPSLPPGGLRDGMKFGITWAAANTGPMTLTITGAGAAPVLSADGAVAAPGLAILGGRALLEYVGGAFRVLSGGAVSGGTARYYWQFTASGTWTKPAGLPDDTMVTIELWGGGGGAARPGGSTGVSNGGSGASYAFLRIRLADLPALVPVTVGSGGPGATGSGSPGVNGGASSFGSLMTAPGGIGGLSTANSSPGGRPTGFGAEDNAGGFAGGDSGVSGTSGAAGGPSVHGGGGGGGGGSNSGGQGGVSMRGGNGGAGVTSGPGMPGEIPGGGGGGVRGNVNGGPGARGEVRIWM